MKVANIKLCSKCLRPTTSGFCDGCGEYATHSKCKCIPLSSVPTAEEIRNKDFSEGWMGEGGRK